MCCAGWRCGSTAGSLRLEIAARTRRIAFGAAGVAALLALVVATVAFDLPDRIADQHRAFVEGNAPPGTADLRTRLTEVGNNGRLAIWRVALEEAKADPWKGGGAGTFQLAWERERPSPPLRASSTATRSITRCGPSSGGSGSRCCWSSSSVPLAVAIRRLWGPGRHLHAAFLAAAVALLAHAMVDWDWEMPARLHLVLRRRRRGARGTGGGGRRASRGG